MHLLAHSGKAYLLSWNHDGMYIYDCLEICEPYKGICRKPGFDFVAVIGNVCVLLANIEPYMRFWTNDAFRTNQGAVESTVETVYFAINILLHAIFALYQYSNEAPIEFVLSPLQRSLLSTFMNYIDITMKDMLGKVSGRITADMQILRLASLLRSPFHACVRGQLLYT